MSNECSVFIKDLHAMLNLTSKTVKSYANAVNEGLSEVKVADKSPKLDALAPMDWGYWSLRVISLGYAWQRVRTLIYKSGYRLQQFFSGGMGDT